MLRPSRLVIIAALAGAIAVAGAAQAQIGGPQRGGQRDRGTGLPAEARATPNETWKIIQAPLPGQRNAGPCPYVKALYDAARYQEFAGGRESAATVGFTGEIEEVEARCKYQADEPIKVQVGVLFALGRGPAAEGDRKTYRYWVAVTRRDSAVITKEFYDLPVKFENGADRTQVAEELGEITIPRANNNIAGTNFEILVGFDVTPQMAAFNREGKRFRLDAVPTAGSAPGQ